MSEASKQRAGASDVLGAIRGISSSDPVEREASRGRLVDAGRLAVIPLLKVLQDSDDHVRWEAAKALEGIADPLTAHALVEAMDDQNGDVRWVAGEALVAIGREGVRHVLTAALTNSASLEFCRAAHHVFSSYAKTASADVLKPVLEQLDGYEPGVTVPQAAYEALQRF